MQPMDSIGWRGGAAASSKMLRRRTIEDFDGNNLLRHDV
jgi:hypothetical protein